MILVTKRVAVAPFELKIGPNESYGCAASVGTPPGAKTAQIRAKIRVNLPPVAHQAGASLCYYLFWDVSKPFPCAQIRELAHLRSLDLDV